jgi:hypothetical protein
MRDDDVLPLHPPGARAGRDPAGPRLDQPSRAHNRRPACGRADDRVGVVRPW